MNRLKIRATPQLSVNQFGRYLEAKGRSRNTILRTAKFPNNKAPIIHYKDASDAIIKYVSSGFDPDIVEEHREKIGNKPTSTIRQDSRLKDCLDALDSFEALTIDELEDRLEGIKIKVAPHNPASGTLSFEGVSISLRPEFYLVAEDKKGNPVKGAVKLYLNKTQSLTDYAGAAIATLLHQFLQEENALTGVTQKALVIVIDVCARKIHSAPKASSNISKDITAACREISRIWDDIRQDD